MKKCDPGSKKFAKRVKACNGEMKCIKFGDKDMPIKKHIRANKKSFCARFNCHLKHERATPGYQSCKKWDCKVGSCKYASRKNRSNKTKSSKHSRQNKIRNPKTGRMVLRTGSIGKSILQKSRRARKTVKTRRKTMKKNATRSRM